MDEDVAVVIHENAKRKVRRNQYIATLLVCILPFSQGSFAGWTSPMIPLLQSPDTPANFPPIEDEEASWVVSINSLSSVFVIPLWSWAVDKLGRKYTGYMVAVPFILSWVLTLCADSVGMLYAARCLGGLSAGGSGVFVPAYINDLAEDDIRGLLGTMFSGSLCLGILYSYAAGSYVSYTWFNASCLALPVVFLVTFLWLPESPLFLATKGKQQEAKRALEWLRDGRQAQTELDRLTIRAEHFAKNEKNKMMLSDIMSRGTWRALLICLLIVANTLLSGLDPVMTYTVTIFQASGSVLSANLSTIIVGAVLTLGTFLSTAVIERSGRRLILVSTSILTALSHVAVGVYFYLKSAGSDVSLIQWLPVTCLSVFILCSGLALVPIPFLMATEVPSPHTRGLVQSISIVFLSIGAFVTAKTFATMSCLMGTHGVFWFYGVSCVVCAVLMYLTVPETRNRSAEEIAAQLNSRHFISSVIFHNRIMS